MTNELELMAPLSGQARPLTEVPDPVFAGMMMGDGLAVDPTSSLLLAPCDGVITQIARTCHALTLTADNGAEILMHIGIDTVTLKGEGFVAHVKQGDRVRCGAPLIEADFSLMTGRVPSLTSVLVIANSDKFVPQFRASGNVTAGQSRFLTIVASNNDTQTPVEPAECNATDAALDGTGAEAIIGHGDGLHARPAALIQAAAKRFNAKVQIEFNGQQANARSVVAIMGLGANQGDHVHVAAHGAEAEDALAAVVAALQMHSPSAQPAAPQLVSAKPSAALLDGKMAGVSAAPGRAIGKIVQFNVAEPQVQAYSGDPHFEFDSLAHALAKIRSEIAAQMHAALVQGDQALQSIFNAHLALLDDPELVGSAERAIATGQSAGQAFRSAAETERQILAQMHNPLLAERANDLKDLERRVLLAISNEEAVLPDLFADSILVADDLTPSDLTRLPLDSVAGVVLARGGATSHVAILVRARGIPALVAVGAAALDLAAGQEVLLDAGAGWLDIHPDQAALKQARHQMDLRCEMLARVRTEALNPARTRDGVLIDVAANIANERDAREAIRQGADGVGLLRSEFLFIDRTQAPTRTEQQTAYQAVLDALQGKCAIMRTLDVGGDKELPYLALPQEPNPALGLRGIRSGFSRPELLDDQLAALLAVRPQGAVRILLPMVADVSDLLRVRRRLESLADEAGLKTLPKLGVMIEVPSAALLADQLALYADFLSIGTNDLTQYTLAMDRCQPEFAAQLDPLHPAVLRLIAQSVTGATVHGRWVGVCGAMASDLDAIPVLLGLGVTELSVSPGLIPEIKARVRALDLEQCRREAQSLLQLSSAQQVRTRAREIWPQD